MSIFIDGIDVLNNKAKRLTNPDLNTVLNSGTYTVTGHINNAPFTGNVMLQVLDFTITQGWDRIYQIAFEDNTATSDKIAYRFITGNNDGTYNYAPWTQIGGVLQKLKAVWRSAFFNRKVATA